MTTHESIGRALSQYRIVPVVSVPSADRGTHLAEALSAGGLPIVEVTFRTEAAAATIEQIRSTRSDVLVGAGTVLDVETARVAISSGAQFVVTPGFNPRVVDYLLEAGIPVIPGACTPTEIDMALMAGLNLLKFFPAEASGGVAYLTAVAAPYAQVRFMPTGGVTLANLPTYFSLPSVAACGGTWIAPTDLIAGGDFERIAENARSALRLVPAS